MSRLETVFAPAESLDADRLFKLTFGAMLAPLWAPVWTVAALRAVADWAPARGSETLSLAAPEPVVTEPVEAPAAAEPATLVPAIEADVTRYTETAAEPSLLDTTALASTTVEPPHAEPVATEPVELVAVKAKPARRRAPKASA